MKETYSYDIKKEIDDYAKTVADKEIKIMNSAIKIFAQKGYNNTKTKEIAKDAGVGEGTIFRYFPNKEAIIEKMLPLILKLLIPRFEKPMKDLIKSNEDTSFEQLLNELIMDRMSIFIINKPFLKAFVPELVHREKLLNQFKEAVIPVIKKHLGAAIEQAYQKGEIKKIEVDFAFSQILGFMIAYFVVDGIENKDKHVMQEDVRIFVSYLIYGWKKDGSGSNE